MHSLLTAIQFLTIIPINLSSIKEKDVARSIIFFPIVGLLLGLFLCTINSTNEFFKLAPLTNSIILIISLIVITGGIHCDGLADTSDGFLSGKQNKDEILAIMRDPHIGTMGVLSLISTILLKVGLLSSLNARIPALLLMCLLSRWSMVFVMFLFPYARQDGKAKIFIQSITPRILMLASLITIIIGFAICGIISIVTFIAIAGLVYLIGKLFTKKIGGITGDTIGAINEISEILILFMLIVFRG